MSYTGVERRKVDIAEVLIPQVSKKRSHDCHQIAAVSRSGEELSTAGGNIHRQDGKSHIMVEQSKRKLSKSHSLQREGRTERTSSMSSDMDSDLMLSGESNLITARSPSINISDTSYNASERTRDWLSPPSERALDERYIFSF